MYKKAAQRKLRFAYRGQIGVEDLFDLGLEALDSIYKDLKRQRGDGTAGLLEEPTVESETLSLQMEIVEDVFQTKKAEAEARRVEADRKAQKARIMEIIAGKQDEALMGKSLEELTAMLEAL